MCGIAGIADVTGRPVDRTLLRAMTSVQAHRGPDGEDLVCRGSVGLGHRRLAIIDLSTGDQPMSSDDGRVWSVFNGEIYNFRELRRDLEATGARFRTQSDTEVILRAYEAEGPACVSRLRGMFAFAILDERTRRLILARDRMGIKPLVYSWDGRRLLFASEIKAIVEGRDGVAGSRSRRPRGVLDLSLCPGAPDHLRLGAEAAARFPSCPAPGRRSSRGFPLLASPLRPGFEHHRGRVDRAARRSPLGCRAMPHGQRRAHRCLPLRRSRLEHGGGSHGRGVCHTHPNLLHRLRRG
jgi:Asparagine synthase (glutamine-hydrolyzing)